MAQFVHNTWPNVTTGQTPYELLYGFMPKMHVTDQASGIPEIEKRKEWLEWACTKAMAALKMAQQLWKK